MRTNPAPVKEALEEVRGKGGDGDDEEREGGRLAVGEVCLIRPKLCGQGLYAVGNQYQGGRELGDTGEEDQADAAPRPGAMRGSVTRRRILWRFTPSEPATSSRAAGA